MASYLFLDDMRLLVREGLTREVGKPEIIPDSVFSVPGAHPCGALERVWKENDHSYHMFYQAFLPDGRHALLASHSTDGIHFTPRNTAREAGIENPVYENQLLERTDCELFSFIDTGKSPGRLKLLLAGYDDDRWGTTDYIYESDDGIHWEKTPYLWHNVGTEPCGSVLYSEELGEYCILCRPMWGARRVALSRTRDFKTFTTPELMLEADALDQPLQETYGLYGFRYKDQYVGIMTMYTVRPGDTWKYFDGYIDGQLSYSLNGAHWMRSLRQPFIRREAPYTGMIFTSDLQIDKDGSVLLYASGSDKIHGAFREDGGAVFVYRLREDGFMPLHADWEGRLRTRETLLQGAFDVNLKAKKATCALFWQDGKPVEGFGHEDCEPFSGDCTHWTPKFGQDISQLHGKIVCIEIKIEQGDVYAINGDFVKMLNTEAWRYEHRNGILPLPQNQ